MFTIIDYPKKTILVGYSGAGKSTLLDFFIRNISKNKLNCVIVDTTSKFSIPKPIRYKGKMVSKYKNENAITIKIQDENDLEKIIKKINDKDKTPIILVVDEIDQYTDTYGLQPETSLFFQQGRNYGHGGLFSIRQVGRLNKQILSNSQTLILFKIYNKSDIDYLSNAIGIDVKELVYDLKPHEFYILDLTNSIIIGKYIYDKKKKDLVNIGGNHAI